MVKKGPCSHCRINTEKPVLCNACGSRYKLKGHLDNYLPKHYKNYGENHLSVEVSEHGNSNESNPDFHFISEQDFGNNVPTRKRSKVVYREMTPLEEFRKQLLSLYRSEKQPKERSPEEDILLDNVNGFIPSSEIGLGVVLLRQILDRYQPQP
ncbi:GATA transcription factor 26 [Vigna angularis]|uniref:GATA transcription factor 26 n=1 Tax=Phaseolus angularis TaxID=3914 RepID=UPI00080A5911|nr:GATA transcription factor 26 [Vigna angularis]